MGRFGARSGSAKPGMLVSVQFTRLTFRPGPGPGEGVCSCEFSSKRLQVAKIADDCAALLLSLSINMHGQRRGLSQPTEQDHGGSWQCRWWAWLDVQQRALHWEPGAFSSHSPSSHRTHQKVQSHLQC